LSIKELLRRFADSLDYFVYGLIFLLGFGALAYVAYVSIIG
jgi:hypothetical protein